jgi:hypothetical protein
MEAPKKDVFCRVQNLVFVEDLKKNLHLAMAVYRKSIISLIDCR